MIKEFEIKEILEAIENISKIEKKDRKIVKKKLTNKKEDVLADNNQVKSPKSDILVVSEMIE